MSKKGMRIVSVFCASMMIMSIVSMGIQNVKASSIAQSKEDKSHNAYLKSIKGIDVTKAFNKYDREYYAESVLSPETQSINIKAETEDPRANVDISGNVNLQTGYNEVKMNVTAENGVTEREYSVYVYKAESNNLSSNADITEIFGIDLNEPFDKERLYYTANVPEEVLYINRFDYTTAQKDAQVYVEGIYKKLDIGQNLIRVSVRAQDGTVKIYTITVTREVNEPEIQKEPVIDEQTLSSNANIKSIKGVTLNEPFDKDTLDYTAIVDRNVKDLDLSVETEDINIGHVSIEGNYNLALGKNKVWIQVYAQDGTEKTYSINVNRGNVSSNTNIVSIKGVDLSEEYSNDESTYFATVPFGISSLDLHVETEDKNATVSISRKKLDVGMNRIYIRVTAPDGTRRNVRIYVEREEDRDISTSADIQDISGEFKLNEQFDPNTLNYTSTWEKGVNEITVTLDKYAEIKITGTSANGRSLKGTLQSQYEKMNTFRIRNVSKGVNILKIEVRGQHKMKKVYTIKITK